MPIAGGPNLELTDSALALLADARRRARAADSAPRVRIRLTRVGGISGLSVDLEFVYLRVVSICEAYIDALFASEIETEIDPQQPTLAAMADEIALGASRGWEQRVEAFKRYRDINLRGVEGWKELDSATEVRNAIAHGLGRLTLRQRRNNQLSKSFAAVDVHLHEHRLHLQLASVETLIRAADKFLRGVDARF